MMSPQSSSFLFNNRKTHFTLLFTHCAVLPLPCIRMFNVGIIVNALLLEVNNAGGRAFDIVTFFDL